MKKMMALFLAMVLLLSCLPALADGSLTQAEVPLCVQSLDDGTDLEITLWFKDGDKCLPYVDSDTIAPLITYVAQLYTDDSDYRLSAAMDGSRLTLVRDNGYDSVIDFAASTVYFTDYNAFSQPTYYPTILDDSSVYSLPYITVTAAFTRYGDAITFDLAQYGISFIYENGKGYMPLSTLSDIFLTDFNCSLIYGVDFVCLYKGSLVDDNNTLTSLGETYFGHNGMTRSAALAAFNYAETCFFLDVNYGLKEEHNIDSFDHLFTNTGLNYSFLSDDPCQTTGALASLFRGYLADFHSYLDVPSFYTGLDYDYTSGVNYSLVYDDTGSAVTTIYDTARDKAFSGAGGLSFYQEVGDTAYLTIDQFTTPDVNYYSSGFSASKSNYEDTISQVMYAHSRITRKDSPIKNVVLDLSCCGGGNTGAGVFVIAWMLGSYTANYEDTYTGAQVSLTYKADVDLDGNLDADDSISDLSLYCLISPATFSCANDVAAALKYSGCVTMLGKQSGGGSCWSAGNVTADGNIVYYSGRVRTNFVRNGSYYNIDTGVPVDFTIASPAHFYDRKALTEYINGLF